MKVVFWSIIGIWATVAHFLSNQPPVSFANIALTACLALVVLTK